MSIEEYHSPTDYEEMLEYQRKIFRDMVEAKRRNDEVNERIILLEHQPVITMGKHAKEANLLFSEDILNKNGFKVFRIERGGDITYHGPGQLVAYPMIDLEKHHLGVKGYVNLLEEAVIRTIAEYGIAGERVEGASGVWIDAGTENERKICAVGVKCSRFVTMHGLALNVNTNLSHFSLINPCGFVDKGVTSIAQELGHNVDFREATTYLKEHLLTLLG